MPTVVSAGPWSTRFGYKGTRRLALGVEFLVLMAALILTQTGTAAGLVTKQNTVGTGASTVSATTAVKAAANVKLIKVTAHLGKATQGVPFSGLISATGGVSPYHFSIRFGSLPAGLSLGKTSGVIAGTPQTAGTSDFTVRVSGHYWHYLTDLGLRMVVDPKAAGITVTVTPARVTVPSGASQQLAAVVHGSTNTQIKWSTSAGIISTSGLFTAPSVTTATTATVTATSAANPNAAASSTISITPLASASLAVSTTALPDASQGSSYSAGLSATGGSQPYAWSISAGSLPAGVSLNASGTLSGNPSKTGSFSFTAKVTDAVSHSATASLTLAVDVTNTNTKFDGPAELPRVHVQSALANTPANGKTWPVADAARALAHRCLGRAVGPPESSVACVVMSELAQPGGEDEGLNYHRTPCDNTSDRTKQQLRARLGHSVCHCRRANHGGAPRG